MMKFKYFYKFNQQYSHIVSQLFGEFKQKINNFIALFELKTIN
jgi:hypothetical protein